MWDHTSFLVSMAGNELSKPSNSSASACAPAEGCWMSEKSPPNRSLSSSSTVATCSLPDAKRSASSPNAARSRSKKLPPAVPSLGRAPESRSSIEGNLSAISRYRSSIFVSLASGMDWMVAVVFRKFLFRGVARRDGWLSWSGEAIWPAVAAKTVDRFNSPCLLGVTSRLHRLSHPSSSAMYSKNDPLKL